MTTSLKAQILSSLACIPDGGQYAESLKTFCRNAHLKTDEDVRECVEQVQAQAADHPEAMKRILGNQYEFITWIKFEVSA